VQPCRLAGDLRCKNERTTFQFHTFVAGTKFTTNALDFRRPYSGSRLPEHPREDNRVLNDAISLYFRDATLAGALVARWCVGSKVETAGGVFRVRDDDEARVSTGAHKTP
jgi:hypothetical protein